MITIFCRGERASEGRKSECLDNLFRQQKKKKKAKKQQVKTKTMSGEDNFLGKNKRPK